MSKNETSAQDPIHHDPLSDENRLLKGCIIDMQHTSIIGFKRISAIAQLIATSLETPYGYDRKNMEAIGIALEAIIDAAVTHENCVGFDAEQHVDGFNDESLHNRRYAHIEFLDDFHKHGVTK